MIIIQSTRILFSVYFIRYYLYFPCVMTYCVPFPLSVCVQVYLVLAAVLSLLEDIPNSLLTVSVHQPSSCSDCESVGVCVCGWVCVGVEGVTVWMDGIDCSIVILVRT